MRVVLASVATLALMAPSLMAQDRYDLRVRAPAKGERTEQTLDGDLRIRAEVSVSKGSEEVNRSVSHATGRMSLRADVEVTDVSGDTVVTRNKIHTAECRLETTITQKMKGQAEQTSKQTQELLKSLKGSDVEIRTAGETVVSIVDRAGKASAEDLQALKDYGYTPNLGLLPEQPVTVGESWKVSGDKLKKMLRPQGEFKITITKVDGAIEGRLDRVAEGIAYISFRGTATIEYEAREQEGEPPVLTRVQVQYDGTTMEMVVKTRNVRGINLQLKYQIEASGEEAGYKTVTKNTIEVVNKVTFTPK